MLRLDRFLAEGTAWSRSEVKKLIRAGRVSVNGRCDVKPEMKIDPASDCILVDSVRVELQGRICLMMNKPAGVLSATQDRTDRTVIDLVSEPYAGRLFPVGRLDKDTEGLLLLTDDGNLSHDLLSPSKHVSKTYFVIITGAPDETIVTRFRQGMDIGERRRTLPAQLVFLSVDGDFLADLKQQEETETPDAPQMPAGMISLQKMQEFCIRSIALTDYDRCAENECCAAVSVTEGKYHQIKRMFQACGREVRFLKRIGMGELMLDPELESGTYRPLTPEELALLEKR